MDEQKDMIIHASFFDAKGVKERESESIEHTCSQINRIREKVKMLIVN